jgi:hypothetical protein
LAQTKRWRMQPPPCRQRRLNTLAIGRSDVLAALATILSPTSI